MKDMTFTGFIKARSFRGLCSLMNKTKVRYSMYSIEFFHAYDPKTRGWYARFEIPLNKLKIEDIDGIEEESTKEGGEKANVENSQN